MKLNYLCIANVIIFFSLATVLFSLSHVRSTDLVCQLFMFCTPIVTTDTVLLTCLWYVLLIYAVLMCPFLNVCIPSILLSHWASLSLFIFSSSCTAHCRRFAISWFPGPTWWSLDSRHSVWALIAASESLRLICPVRTPS